MPEANSPGPIDRNLDSESVSQQANNCLLAAPAHLTQIFASFPEALLCLTADWRISFANELAMRISHLRPEDIGRDHWEIYPETLGTEIEATYRRAMQDRTREHFEFFYPPLNTWYELNIVPEDQGGLIFYYRSTTDKRHAEKSRDEANRQLAQVYAASPEAILIIDSSWTFILANQQCIDLLNSGPLVGENVFERFPGNYEEPFFSNYTRTMKERIPTEFEAFYPAPLNRWFRVLARPFNDTSLILFFSDITSRKRAELAREQVLELTDDGVASFDHDFRFTYLNRRGRQILAASGRQLLGQVLWETFPAAIGTVFETSYRRTMDEHVATSFQAFYGEPLNIWLDIDARPSEEGIIVFYRDVTARKAAEATRDRTLAQLNQVFEATNDAILSLDRDWNMFFLNRRARELLSPAGDVTGKNLWKTFPETASEDLPYLRAYHRAMEERLPANFEAFYPEPLNLWLDIEARPSNEGIVLFFRDITSRKANEDALLTSESRYRVLADLNPQALWSSSPTGQITYANQGFLDYLGLDAPEPDNWVNVFDPADQTRATAAWTHAIQTGHEYDIEARLVRASDQSSRWWRLRGLPVRDEAGTIVQWLGVANDIQDTRTFAEQLQKQQIETERQRAELETVYENTPVGLGLFDAKEFRYLRLNDELARMIGLPKEKILGRTVSEVTGIPAVPTLFQQVVAGAPLTGHLLRNVEFAHRPGEVRSFNLNYSPLFDETGRVTAITTASLDVTQQQRTEAALIQSEKLAAVGRLASSISHEINNPLEAITNLLYLTALDEKLPETVKTYVHLAQAELSRVSQIATQTLRFHRQAVRPTYVTAAQLVDAVLNLYQGRLGNSGIRVQAVYATVTPILCFENDIRQVLNNLIANAIDAMRSGGRLIARAHDVIDSPTGRRGLRITIADTGHGMNEATRQRIFEPFYTTKDLNGTGLGLWISTGIVQRHSGRLTVRTSQHPVHHGTAFSLFLPFASPLP